MNFDLRVVELGYAEELLYVDVLLAHVRLEVVGSVLVDQLVLLPKAHDLQAELAEQVLLRLELVNVAHHEILVLDILMD